MSLRTRLRPNFQPMLQGQSFGLVVTEIVCQLCQLYLLKYWWCRSEWEFVSMIPWTKRTSIVCTTFRTVIKTTCCFAHHFGQQRPSTSVAVFADLVIVCEILIIYYYLECIGRRTRCRSGWRDTDKLPNTARTARTADHWSACVVSVVSLDDHWSACPGRWRWPQWLLARAADSHKERDDNLQRTAGSCRSRPPGGQSTYLYLSVPAHLVNSTAEFYPVL